MKNNHTHNFFDQVKKISEKIDLDKIELLCHSISKIRINNGRLFFIGVGGSAANCSHAVNDFRKLCGIEAYSPLDNISELTARINDEGWNGAFAAWLLASRLNSNDGVFIMSVGGGNIKKNVSVNIVKAIDYAIKVKSKIFGIVGHEGGYTAEKADIVIKVPLESKSLITPHTEAFASVVWHAMVSNPILQVNPTKW